MYKVEMKYLDKYDESSLLNFTCDKFDIKDDAYKFENIQMDNFVLSDLEVDKNSIALMKIK